MSAIRNFFRVLRALWKFGAALAPLFEKLPDVLPLAGDAMILSGQNAIDVSKVLKKDGGLPVNMQAMVEEIAKTVQFNRDAVANAVNALHSAAATLNNIKIPMISPKFETFFGIPIPIVVGINIGYDTPFFPLRDGLNLTAQQLDTVRRQMEIGYARTNELSQTLGTAGADLQIVGTAMRDCGQIFKDAVT